MKIKSLTHAVRTVTMWAARLNSQYSFRIGKMVMLGVQLANSRILGAIKIFDFLTSSVGKCF